MWVRIRGRVHVLSLPVPGERTLCLLSPQFKALQPPEVVNQAAGFCKGLVCSP